MKSMWSHKVEPLLSNLDFDQIEMMVTDDGKSETLIGISDSHAFVSHNMGISWKKIDNISGCGLKIWPQYNEMQIIDEYGSAYLLDSEGNVFKEVHMRLNLILQLNHLSRHPKNPNVLLASCAGHTYANAFDSDNQKWYFYTKDGGMSGWKEMESNEDADPLFRGPDYEFIDGGSPDLIYKYDEDSGRTEYSLNFFSESPLEFKKLSSEVYKLSYNVSENQSVFFQLKDLKELYVSRDGVNFEHIEFPPPNLNSIECKIHGEMIVFGQKIHQFTDARFKGSLFIQKLYPESEKGRSNSNTWLPWTTLFRYDVESNKMKLLLEYCYDLTVVSAEEGIVIANSVTNPQECLNNNEEPNIRTMITFDDGTNWEPMKGPSETELSIANSFLLDPLSSPANDEKPSVPGLLIVHGKEGPLEHYMGKRRRESEFHSSFSTYITKDSGRSWRKIHDDAMDWTIGGSGDIIILHSTPLEDHIFYSLDGGMKWHQFKLGLSGLQFAIPPYGCASKRFLLNHDNWENKGPFYCLNFDPADQKK